MRREWLAALAVAALGVLAGGERAWPSEGAGSPSAPAPNAPDPDRPRTVTAPCFDHAELVKALADLGESLAWSGSIGDSSVVSLYLSRDGTSWTIAEGGPTRLDCLSGAGERWAFPKEKASP